MPSTVGLQKTSTRISPGVTRLVDGSVRAGEGGSLVIPGEVLDRAGIQPGDGLICEVLPSGGLRLASDALRKVYVEATSCCNLACVTCIRNAWDEPVGYMPMARFERLLAGLPAPQTHAVESKSTGLWGSRSSGQAAPLPSSSSPITLAFGGFGEPLVHPDFLEMVRLARDCRLRVEVTTNGTLLDAALARELAASGVVRVTISLDGPDAGTYAGVRGSALEVVLANLTTLLEARRRARHPLSVGLAFVAMRRTIASLPELLRLAAQVGVDFVTVSNVIPHTPDMASESLWNRAAWATSFPSESWRPRLNLAALDLDETTRPVLQAVWGTGLDAPLPALDEGSPRNYCRFAQEGVTCVAWDGRVAPCLSLLHTHPEYVNEQWHTVKHYAVGLVDERPLREIWRDAAYRDLRARLRAFDFSHCFTCGGCPLTESNEEDCYGNPFPVCGECLWAQGIVLCP
jgi:MoaA/NifB/PqqE/SkfB family radical SAM enzyme